MNREKNFLIVHPDILVSGTRVLPIIHSLYLLMCILLIRGTACGIKFSIPALICRLDHFMIAYKLSYYRFPLVSPAQGALSWMKG